MTSEINLSIKVTNPHELIDIIRSLAGMGVAVSTAAVSPDMTEFKGTIGEEIIFGEEDEAAEIGDNAEREAEPDPQTPAKRRGRKKAPANQNVDGSEPMPETPAQPAQEPVADTNPASNATANVVADLTPEKAREAAITQLQQFFGKNPNNMAEITRLQAKYGVKMFKEVSDERAAEFLADVKLIASGNAVAA